ncbi:MAG: GNAT family N-acetyltransferase [bacterium]|nr:GNAT family N-acetyltransferase [bacterium]
MNQKAIKSLPFPFIDRMHRAVILRSVNNEFDRHLILKMYGDFYPKKSFQGLPPDDPDQMENWVDNFLDKAFNIIGLTIDEQVICHGSIFRIDNKRSEFVIAVMPKFQNAGIGTQLTRMIKKISYELGFKSIWLSVEPFNRQAKHIYTKLGFQVVSQHACDDTEMIIDLESDPATKTEVREIMTKNVSSLTGDHSISDAVTLFLKNDICGIPIIEANNSIAGFLTETDLLENMNEKRKISEIMTRNVFYVEDRTRVVEIIKIISETKLKQIPIVCGKTRTLVGIVTRKDIIRHIHNSHMN